MGMFGDVTATVTVAGGKISEITYEAPMETPYVGIYAIEDIIEEVMAGQDINVDTVSGATASSNAIRKALENALQQAG